MKTPSESTLLRWNRQIKAGTSTEATEKKLVDYVRHLNATTGFTPALLMAAYYKIADCYPWPEDNNVKA